MATRLFLCPSTGLWVQAWFVGNGSVDGDETYKGVTCLACRSTWSIRRPARYWAPMKRPTDQRRTCRPGSVPADAQRAKERPGTARGFLELTMKGNPGITVP